MRRGSNFDRTLNQRCSKRAIQKLTLVSRLAAHLMMPVGLLGIALAAPPHCVIISVRPDRLQQTSFTALILSFHTVAGCFTRGQSLIGTRKSDGPVKQGCDNMRRLEQSGTGNSRRDSSELRSQNTHTQPSSTWALVQCEFKFLLSFASVEP